MILYQFGVRLYGFFIHLAALWNKKALQWVEGRKAQNHHIPGSAARSENSSRLWMHVASLGEFEQGRLLLESIKQKFPETHITVSFYSPSGYQQVDSSIIDQKLYLPLDKASNARKFLDFVRPDLVVFVKYEFWFNHLKECKKRGIPVIFVSALFRKTQWFFNPLFRKMKNVLRQVDQIFVQDKESENTLLSHGFKNIKVAGDNRVDRVMKIARTEVDFSTITKHLTTPVDLICGSIWPEDAKILIPLLQEKQLSAIIAPHEMNPKFLKQIDDAFPGQAIRYSQIDQFSINEKRIILILDTIGQLSKIYRLGKMAYVGGGFKTGIHNTLEPAAYGIPVIFGPKYQKFSEAKEFIRLGVSKSVVSYQEIKDAYEYFDQSDNQSFVRSQLIQYFENNIGGTKMILDYTVDKEYLN
jgi:3-deoxy-D-manno-octulosonic-acid transferase